MPLRLKSLHLVALDDGVGHRTYQSKIFKLKKPQKMSEKYRQEVIDLATGSADQLEQLLLRSLTGVWIVAYYL